jgi:hypothetical protein
MNGQLILQENKSLFDKINNNVILSIIHNNCQKFTFKIFMFYLNLVKQKNIILNNDISINAVLFLNSDDRIYKYMITNDYFNDFFNNDQSI